MQHVSVSVCVFLAYAYHYVQYVCVNILLTVQCTYVYITVNSTI